MAMPYRLTKTVFNHPDTLNRRTKALEEEVRTICFWPGDIGNPRDRLRAYLDAENAGNLPEGYAWDLDYTGPGRRLMALVYDEGGVTVVDRVPVWTEYPYPYPDAAGDAHRDVFHGDAFRDANNADWYPRKRNS